MAGKKVLITGMSGLIGGALRARLEGNYELSALNRRDVPGVTCHRADIGELEAILPAFQGIDVVVHLAASVETGAPFATMLHHNVVGTYNVFEAARRGGVTRVVYASSGATVANWEREMPYNALAEGRYEEVADGWRQLTHESPLRPTGLYGCSKVWGEALARHFADTTPLSILCLRIGRVTEADRPTTPREFSVWCSQRDVARLLEACIEAPETLKFDIFYGVSDNRWSYRDMEHVRDVLGFVPEDRAEHHR